MTRVPYQRKLHPATEGSDQMARKYVDCREMPSESNCTVAIAADSEDEVVEAAVQHAVVIPAVGSTRSTVQLAGFDYRLRRPRAGAATGLRHSITVY